jgi:hypothetical protein
MTVTPVFAKIYVGDPANKSTAARKAADCVPASGSSQLMVNNVRAYIETSGSMWFRSSKAEYFIPKEGQAASMFAAALWIGGRDIAGQLKLAAIRFRQNGNDFWPGPLTLVGAIVDQATCAKYDKHFFMSKVMAKEHKERYKNADYVMPEAIKNWPGNPVDGNTEQSWYIAPYVDIDGDGAYIPEKGDYPYYDFENELCPWTPENRARAARGELPKTPETEKGISSGGIMADQVLKGDETLWWIFNDKGGAHTESKGDPIGLEIRAQAFGFATTDELNNMTFYSYEIINRSTYALTETYFSQWVDADVGDAKDDYVGCDVGRGLGYCYNGKIPDGTGLVTDYGDTPPAVGVDFFQGPYLDPDGYDNPSYLKKADNNVYGPSFDAAYKDNTCQIVTKSGTLETFTWDSAGILPNGKDTLIKVTRQSLIRSEAINGVNFGDGIVDNERYGMRRFVYHNNDPVSMIGDPSIAVDYYNLLRGIWKDNTPMRYGRTGHGGENPICDFMFPGNSDTCYWGTKGTNVGMLWTEEAVGNPPGDRRFMQSAGPFTLQKGAINYITVGIPWARATRGGIEASVELLKVADDKAQTLFEGCFKTLDGPDAPDLACQELDKRVIFYIANAEGSNNAKKSNNAKESYRELDYSIPEYRIKTVEEIVPKWIYTITIDTVKDSKGQDSLVYIKDADSTLQRIAVTKYDTVKYEQHYVFEGYQVYQLVNESVGPDELSDVTKAQLVYQCDIKNGVKQIINYEHNAAMGTEVPVEKVNGNDNGINHSFTITEDKFGGALVNYKKYYYMAVAYGYNNYETYSTSPDNPDGLYGQKKPYLQGRGNVKVYTVIPHVPNMEENGTIAQSVYGSQPQIIQLEGQGNGGFALQLEQQTIDEILKNNRTDSLIFKKNHGPIGVKVVDPLKMIGADFTLRFYNPDSSIDAVTKDTRWELIYGDSVIKANTSISVQNEQLQGHYVTGLNTTQFVLDLGLSITVVDARFSPLDDFVNSDNSNAYIFYSSVNFISSTVEFTNSEKPWLSGVPDVDGSYPANWIRGGTTRDGDWTIGGIPRTYMHSLAQRRNEDYYYPMSYAYTEGGLVKSKNNDDKYTAYYDKNKQFGKVSEGSGSLTWSPYALASIYDNNPGYGYLRRERSPMTGSDTVWENKEDMFISPPLMTELYSVYIVLTSNKDLWTRSPVVEISDDTSSSVGGAIRHNLRKSPSVDKEGKPDGTGTGMGWFPGYAICVETGERLNIMFGENSSLPMHNGMDMLFNPTSVVSDLSGYVMGGGHYIYIMGHRDLFDRDANYVVKEVTRSNICPSYDQGEWLKDRLNNIEKNTNKIQKITHKNYLYKNVMWTTIPLSNNYPWLEEGNDVKINISVSRPYQRWSSTKGTGVSNPRNNDLPLYKFSTKDLAVIHGQRQVLESYMDSIYVTPNPYYGMSRGYESTQLDTRVKFVNLPKNCKIKVFSMDGTLIRSLNKDDETTYLEWDLKNAANIPIASGMYLIHVRDEVYNIEKTLKFLCIQRPVDVNAF